MRVHPANDGRKVVIIDTDHIGHVSRAMTPRNDLASTGYCPANPGREYLVYLPQGGEATVDLTGAGGTLSAEWMNTADGATTPGATLSGGSRRTFKAPFSGDAVLYIRTNG